MKIQQARYQTAMISEETSPKDCTMAPDPNKIVQLTQVIQADYYRIDPESIADRIINRSHRLPV